MHTYMQMFSADNLAALAMDMYKGLSIEILDNPTEYDLYASGVSRESEFIFVELVCVCVCVWVGGLYKHTCI
jgi:hypothetical protein